MEYHLKKCLEILFKNEIFFDTPAKLELDDATEFYKVNIYEQTSFKSTFLKTCDSR